MERSKKEVEARLDAISEYLAKIGSKGGQATGKRKARSPEHYKRMAAKSARVRKAKAKRRTDGD